MDKGDINNLLTHLASELEGELHIDESMRVIYATDASVYREKPLAVARPRNASDIKKLIRFATTAKLGLIPRAAGTSLAGQVVGNGIIVDISTYMNQILEFNAKERWIKVEPGVVLTELNQFVKAEGLFFGPETSTADYCMIGGMLGNNACGAHSLVYGSTRDHVIEMEVILSDGSKAVFGELSKAEFEEKCQLDSLEGTIYRNIRSILSDKGNQERIKNEYPDKALKRRNTGYAIDILLDSDPFMEDAPKFNFCKLLTGSEGTLAYTTAVKLNLVPLPPTYKALLCVHMENVRQALEANLIALKYSPVAVELMDNTILKLAERNIEQQKNRFFIQGNPGALLIVEFAEDSFAAIEQKAHLLEAAMRKAGYGYHFPLISGSDINKVWALRKAGLGILNNMPGDAKPVAVVEDTAVLPEKLPDYVDAFDAMLKKHGKSCVYYAHISTGELHLRPVLNLKDPDDVVLFHTLALETAKLVREFKGSLSGEHGDGRLRGAFIPLMIGKENFELLKSIKASWDPNFVFNPNKIIDTPPMNSFLRYSGLKNNAEIQTVYDFSEDMGILRAAEKCNGTAVCRKTEKIGGMMCPSYMGSREERNTTRARANILREFLSRSTKANPFDHKEIYDIMDLCLSCKACKSECPSSVDIAKLKAEFLQHYYDANGAPMRARLIANIALINRIGSTSPRLTNAILRGRFTAPLIKKVSGFASKRTIPTLYKTSLDAWFKKQKTKSKTPATNGAVYLFNDEFTRFNDTDIGIDTILLLTNLGFEVRLPSHVESGRSFLSKGFVRKAARLAEKNIEMLSPLITEESPLVGIEPSAILSFRDEYPELVRPELKENAKFIAKHAYTIEEFLAKAYANGKFTSDAFIEKPAKVLYHGHCHQKALGSTEAARSILAIPQNNKVEEIPSGCCGMAGAFGYEAEHYELSMKIGELVLFPALRKSNETDIIAASGTSCRHQIADGTGKKAKHPVSILYEALKAHPLNRNQV